MVARQLSEPQTANWTVSEAGWSHEPTRRVLKRLVDDGILHRDDSGTHATCYLDYRRQAMQEAMCIRDSEHTVEELTDRLADMKVQIRDWSMNPMSSRRTSFAGPSPKDHSMPTKRITAVRSPASGNTSNGVSTSSASLSANGTFSRRRQSLPDQQANCPYYSPLSAAP